MLHSVPPGVLDKRLRLVRYLTQLRHVTTEFLISVARDADRPALLRAAAVRTLLAEAPLEITQGSGFAQRRRFIRSYYRV